jgi:hypothetical protein
LSEFLWFLLGGSLSFNFFLLWKLAEYNDVIEAMGDVPEPEKEKTDG